MAGTSLASFDSLYQRPWPLPLEFFSQVQSQIASEARRGTSRPLAKKLVAKILTQPRLLKSKNEALMDQVFGLIEAIMKNGSQMDSLIAKNLLPFLGKNSSLKIRKKAFRLAKKIAGRKSGLPHLVQFYFPLLLKNENLSNWAIKELQKTALENAPHIARGPLPVMMRKPPAKTPGPWPSQNNDKKQKCDTGNHPQCFAPPYANRGSNLLGNGLQNHQRVF